MAADDLWHLTLVLIDDWTFERRTQQKTAWKNSSEALQCVLLNAQMFCEHRLILIEPHPFCWPLGITKQLCCLFTRLTKLHFWGVVPSAMTLEYSRYEIEYQIEGSGDGSSWGDTLPETNSSHLKIDGWKTILSFWGPACFQELWLLVSGRVIVTSHHISPPGMYKSLVFIDNLSTGAGLLPSTLISLMFELFFLKACLDFLSKLALSDHCF